MTQDRQQAFSLTRYRRPMACILVGLLAACDMPPERASPPPSEPTVAGATTDGPEGAAPGTCWGKTITPAVVERVSERVQVSPAEINTDGTVATPPVYRIEERQIIAKPRGNDWFETPCADVLTPEFISSVQRAMQARGAYAGEITGKMDAPTRAAIQALQRQTGPDSDVLSIETARSLGLIAVERTPAE